jgi:hypothetical protein
LKTYWFVEEDTAQKVVEYFTNLGVAHDIFFVRLNQLVFTDREILKNLIIKVDFA